MMYVIALALILLTAFNIDKTVKLGKVINTKDIKLLELHIRLEKQEEVNATLQVEVLTLNRRIRLMEQILKKANMMRGVVSPTRNQAKDNVTHIS